MKSVLLLYIILIVHRHKSIKKPISNPKHLNAKQILFSFYLTVSTSLQEVSQTSNIFFFPHSFELQTSMFGLFFFLHT